MIICNRLVACQASNEFFFYDHAPSKIIFPAWEHENIAIISDFRLIPAHMIHSTLIEPDKNARARALCEKARWPEVLAFARQWHAEDPADAKALFYQGVAQVSLGRLVEAETSYRRALALDGTDFKTWNNLAALLFNVLNQPAEGAKCMAEALKIEPGNPLGWANLASMNGRLNRHAQALACADRALALDPDMVEAHLHRARAAQMLGRREIVSAVSAALAKLSPEKFGRTR
jgi:tetratricopeptide (TPR) repeat protein